MTSQLSPAQARAITTDWGAQFPQLKPWRPLRLLRRLGPLLQGITLERSSSGDDYLPTSHLHALTRPFPVVTLTLAQRLAHRNGAAWRIHVNEHAAKLSMAAATLREQSVMPLDLPPSPAEVLACYREFIVSQPRLGVPTAMNELEDLICLATIMGEAAAVRGGLSLAAEISDEWEWAPVGYPDVSGWLAHLTTLASDPAALCKVVSGEIDKHKLGSLPNAWEAVSFPDTQGGETPITYRP